MNEKLQYATMLEIPVNTANITYKPKKSRRRVKAKGQNSDAIKEELMQKVNSESETAVAEDTANAIEEQSGTPYQDIENASAVVHKKERKPFFKFSAVGIEVVAVFALVATIFLTNAFYADSAINVFMRKVFAPTEITETVKEKTYDEFKPVMNFNGEMTVTDGVISCTGSGAVYSPLDGTVTSVTLDGNGAYTVEIAHSGVFSSKISGLTYAYIEEGDAVYGNIPVGYVQEGGFTMCFNDEDAVITDYTIEDNAVLWAV